MAAQHKLHDSKQARNKLSAASSFRPKAFFFLATAATKILGFTQKRQLTAPNVPEMRPHRQPGSARFEVPLGQNNTSHFIGRSVKEGLIIV